MLGDREYMRPDEANGTYSSRRQDKTLVKKLIIINVLVFIIEFITGEFSTKYAHYGGLKSILWLSVPTLRENFEFWRVATYMFSHGGFWHLFLNMWSLYIFGKQVEERIGPSTFLKLYFVSGIIGGLCWILANLNSSVPLIGASGAIFGVMAAAAMLFPRMQILLLFPPVVLQVKTLVICIAILNIIMLYSEHSQNIAYLAHLGGLLGGYLFIGKYSTSRKKQHKAGAGLDRIFKTALGSVKDNLKGKSPSRKSHAPDLKFVDEAGEVFNEDAINSEIDPILDKIGKYGMKSLSVDEKRILERAREKLKDHF